jgi:MinD-like ATPase involved in chromosome partitioning or flagellar assembly
VTVVFAASDKGGTGRSVTSTNVAYRHSLLGRDVCYVDFDFGSPTSGAIFNIGKASRGTMSSQGGLHAYFAGQTAEPVRIDVWTESDRSSMRQRPPSAGRLVLLPGDQGGGEFPCDDDQVRRCVRLLLRLSGEFHLVLVDLSAGRSYATQMVLAALAEPQLRRAAYRWLVFHRWTRQHIIAAESLVYGEHGLLEAGVARGHDRAKLAQTIRFVRTAVVDPDSPELAGLPPTKVTWLRECNAELQTLARRHRVGRTVMLGMVPLDPVLQWREQLISNNDVFLRHIANEQTVQAFEEIAKRLTEDAAWDGL